MVYQAYKSQVPHRFPYLSSDQSNLPQALQPSGASNLAPLQKARTWQNIMQEAGPTNGDKWRFVLVGIFKPKNVTSFKRWLASWVGGTYKVCENGRWQWWQQLFRTFRCLQVVQFVVLRVFENVEITCFAEKKPAPWWGAWVLSWNCCKCWATGCGGGGPTLPIFIQNRHALSRYFHKQLCEPSF